MEIEVYSDVICPWCYVATARLWTALASFDREVTLRWRAFQLDPGASRECRGMLDWLSRRLAGGGSHGEDRARQYVSQVTSGARAEGLRLNLDRCMIVNTFDAHRLLWFADQPQAVLFGATAATQPELADALYRAHLTDGLDVGCHDVLVSLAASVGLAAERVRRLLATNEGTADVRAQLARAHDLGVTSVPTFIFAGTYAITGAHSVQTLRSALDAVTHREGMGTTVRRIVPSQRTTPARDDDFRVA